MSVIASSLNPANSAMSPITTYPQSGGVPLERSNNFRAKRTASPQRESNGYSPAKSSSLLSPRKTSKRFFRRPTLEKNHVTDPQLQGNERKKQGHSQPRVEIIYKDPPSESESDKETVVASLKKAFEEDGVSLRPSSTHSGEWSPSTISDESTPSTPLLNQCLDVNMNRVSSGSNVSHIDRVVQEIVSTEQAYVKHLEEIIEGYLQKMRRQSSPVNEQDVNDLFMNIEEIYQFNKNFLSELDECGDDPVEIAMKFASKGEGFATYTDYCTNYPRSVEVLTKLTQSTETAEFIKNIQVGLGHALPLGSYLLKPVQRILKYHLLLEDMQKHFDKDSDTEGYDMVSDALSAMTGVAQHINEMKRQHEVTVHVQEIQSQMSDFEGPDLTTYGCLVLEDCFRVLGTRSDRYLFLFKQILLITKRKENGFSCKATIRLSNMMMTEQVPKEPLAFQLIHFDNQKIHHTFCARSCEQKTRWTLELKRLIVDSSTASVPLKAKKLLLGQKNYDEVEDSETSECESKKRSGSIDSRSNRGVQAKGPPIVTSGPRRELGRKSDDEGEPRSLADINLSDENKETVPRQPQQTSTQESLEESEENPSETEATESEEFQSPTESVDVRVEGWERRLSSMQSDTDWRESAAMNESSENEKEEPVHEQEECAEPAKMYIIEDARGEILGSSQSGDQENITLENVEGTSVDFGMSSQEANELNVKPASIKAGDPVLRERSGSFSESVTAQTSRGSNVTEGRDDERVDELGRLGFARVRLDSGRVQKHTTRLGLLEAVRSEERSTSAIDLREIHEESSAVFSDKDIANFTEYSAIQKTVRKVSQAFSGSSTPTEKSPPSEAQMRSVQTRYIVESGVCEISPPDKDTSISGSDSSHHSLEEMLAAIDRDLEDTRRTISCAQLLESALLIKNENKPLVGKSTDSLRCRGRPRIIDFSRDDESNSDEVKMNCAFHKTAHRHKRGINDKGETDSFTAGNQKPRKKGTDFYEDMKTEEKKPTSKQIVNLQTEIKTRNEPPCKAEPSRVNHAENDSSTRVRANSQSEMRVFELFADTNHNESKHIKNQSKENSVEKDQVVTREGSKLPSVYQMARQYSQKVTDKRAVEVLRMRVSGSRDRAGSDTFCDNVVDITDHTPKIKIERVTKVSISNSPIEAYKLVKRRKRRSGSSRHRPDELRRSSWSIEKVKPDSEAPRKERPKSVYDIEALEDEWTESMEQIEEGLEPMIIKGLDKDDVVVRGLVQHLVGKFNSQ